MPEDVSTMTAEELENELQTDHGFAADEMPGTDDSDDYRNRLEEWVKYERGRPYINSGVDMDVTSSGGVYLETTDDSGDVRRVELNPQADGTLEVVSQAPDGTEKRGKVDPSGGGSQSLGI